MTAVNGEFSHISGLHLPALAPALALGTDISGDATLIGASTNVVEASWFFIQE
jgi:Na+/H+ antiporter NhaD/arsenite permease-like protein